MYIYILFLHALIPLISSSSLCQHFTSQDIINFQGTKNIVLMFYFNEQNTTHHSLFTQYTNLYDKYKNIRSNYTFGYIDSYLDRQLLTFFRLKNVNDTGFIIYIFAEDLFYFEESITEVSQIEAMITNMENRKINWYSTGIIERIFDYIAGKRLGQRAYTYFTAIVSVIAIIVYVSANIWSKQVEKSLKQQEQQAKTPQQQQSKHMKSD